MIIMQKNISSQNSAERLLTTFFERNGCVRLVNEKRREQEGQKYKKGYEVRLVAYSEEELKNIRQLLLRVGFKVGKSYKKHRQIIQPIYGKTAVEWFMGRAKNLSS
jgi:hypothetical protein